MAKMLSFETNIQQFARSLAQFARVTERDLDGIVAGTAAQVLADTQRGWPVDEGVSRAAWRRERVGFAHQRLRNPTVYARTIEFGGYRGTGPKTERIGPASLLPSGLRTDAGIYPSQRPNAPLTRALNRNLAAMERDTYAMLQRRWRQG